MSHVAPATAMPVGQRAPSWAMSMMGVRGPNPPRPEGAGAGVGMRISGLPPPPGDRGAPSSSPPESPASTVPATPGANSDSHTPTASSSSPPQPGKAFADAEKRGCKQFKPPQQSAAALKPGHRLYAPAKRHRRSRMKRRQQMGGAPAGLSSLEWAHDEDQDSGGLSYCRQNALGLRVLCLCGQDPCRCRGGGRFVDEGGRWVKKQPTESEQLAQVQGCIPFYGNSDVLVSTVSVAHIPPVVLTRSHPSWLSNRSASRCTICTRTFTLFFRRHHCRGCGILICSICSVMGEGVPPPWRAQRLCSSCHSSLFLIASSQHQREGGGSSASGQQNSRNSLPAPAAAAVLSAHGKASLSRTYS